MGTWVVNVEAGQMVTQSPPGDLSRTFPCNRPTSATFERPKLQTRFIWFKLEDLQSSTQQRSIVSNIGQLISTPLILYQSCTDQSAQVDQMIKPLELLVTVSAVFLGETRASGGIGGGCQLLETSQDSELVNLSLVQGTQSAALPCSGKQKDTLAFCTSVHKYKP